MLCQKENGLRTRLGSDVLLGKTSLDSYGTNAVEFLDPLDTGRQAAVCQRRPNLGPAPLIPFSYAEKIAAQPDFCNEFSIGKRLEGWWKVTLSNCGNAFESTSMTGAQPFDRTNMKYVGIEFWESDTALCRCVLQFLFALRHLFSY